MSRMSRSEVHVSRTSNRKLTRTTYIFRSQGVALRYSGVYIEHRSTTKELWALEQPTPMSYREWCKANHREYDDFLEPNEDEAYRSYRDKGNPIRQRTTSGLPRLQGSYSDMLCHLPRCPPAVAAEARKQFCERLIVEYKPTQESK